MSDTPNSNALFTPGEWAERPLFTTFLDKWKTSNGLVGAYPSDIYKAFGKAIKVSDTTAKILINGVAPKSRGLFTIGMPVAPTNLCINMLAQAFPGVSAKVFGAAKVMDLLPPQKFAPRKNKAETVVGVEAPAGPVTEPVVVVDPVTIPEPVSAPTLPAKPVAPPLFTEEEMADTAVSTRLSNSHRHLGEHILNLQTMVKAYPLNPSVLKVINGVVDGLFTERTTLQEILTPSEDKRNRKGRSFNG